MAAEQKGGYEGDHHAKGGDGKPWEETRAGWGDDLDPRSENKVEDEDDDTERRDWMQI